MPKGNQPQEPMHEQQRAQPARQPVQYPEATMSEYIAGFNDGYAYVLHEIERNRHLTADELLKRLKGDVEQKSQAN